MSFVYNKIKATSAFLCTSALKLIQGLINTLPYQFRLRLASLLVRVIFFFLPKYRQIALVNLKIAFPEKSEPEFTKLYEQGLLNLARLVIDFLRLPRLSKEWFLEHVSFANSAEIRNLVNDPASSGTLFISGHLGSFEILPTAIAAHIDQNFAYIVRPFKQTSVDHWWNGIRTHHGNLVVRRTGAVREIVKYLKDRKPIAMLFDQNVTRNNALFVNWFGIPAATTKAAGFLACRYKLRVVVFGFRHLEQDNYQIDAEVVDMSDIYAGSLDLDQQSAVALQRMVNAFEGMIRKDPGSWFWFHRRWKTRPSPEDKLIY